MFQHVCVILLVNQYLAHNTLDVIAVISLGTLLREFNY